jgi:hypothetical protein
MTSSATLATCGVPNAMREGAAIDVPAMCLLPALLQRMEPSRAVRFVEVGGSSNSSRASTEIDDTEKRESSRAQCGWKYFVSLDMARIKGTKSQGAMVAEARSKSNTKVQSGVWPFVYQEKDLDEGVRSNPVHSNPLNAAIMWRVCFVH